MTSTTSSGWRELPRSTRSECPKLFYYFSTEKDRFNLKLTDLVAIWECSLDRASIHTAAKEQHSSIDPSESGAQLRVLLNKLEQSLENGRNYLFRAKNENLQTVYLQTNLDLPKPLKALSWTFNLEPQDAGELAEQLLRPCLHTASVAQQKNESLLRVIKDKDHVLSRLLEKIDSSAIDLSLIFPGITGLKSRKARITVKEAQKHVPGMAEFDVDRWATSFENGSPYAGFDQMGMEKLVAGCERCPKHTLQQHSSWYIHLPVRGSEVESLGAKATHSNKRKTPEPTQDKTASDTDSDFERQATPPHLKKAGNASERSTRAGQDDGSTDSSIDEARPAKKQRTGRLGELSSRTKATRNSKSSSRSPDTATQATRISKPKSHTEQQTQPNRTTSDNDTETASEPNEPAKQASTKSSRQTDKRKLGKLTAHSSKQQSPASSSAQSSKHTSPQPHPAPPQRGKISGLRKKPLSQQESKSSSETESDDDDVSKPRAPTGKANQASDTESDNDDDDNTTSSNKRKLGHLPQHNQTSSLPQTKPKKQATKENAGSDTETASEAASDPESGSVLTKKRHRLGSISSPESKSKGNSSVVGGGNSEVAHRAVSGHNSDSTPVPDAEPEPEPEPKPEPVKEETVEEKADRRREELKKRLTAGGGGRKKRKF